MGKFSAKIERISGKILKNKVYKTVMGLTIRGTHFPRYSRKKGFYLKIIRSKKK